MVRQIGAEYTRRLRRHRPRVGRRWHVDEVFIRIGGTIHSQTNFSNLRSKCQVLEERIMHEDRMGFAPTKEQ